MWDAARAALNLDMPEIRFATLAGFLETSAGVLLPASTIAEGHNKTHKSQILTFSILVYIHTLFNVFCTEKREKYRS